MHCGIESLTRLQGRYLFYQELFIFGVFEIEGVCQNIMYRSTW